MGIIIVNINSADKDRNNAPKNAFRIVHYCLTKALQAPIRTIKLGLRSTEGGSPVANGIKAKTIQLLTYIIQNRPSTSITSLMKISYIIDLVAIKKNKNKLTDFEYIRYNYGPFDKKIYIYLKNMISQNDILEDSELAETGDEFIVYNLNKKKSEPVFDKLKDEEIETINEVLRSVKAYGPKALTELAYQTRPMKLIGAKLGNKKGLNERLDLNA